MLTQKLLLEDLESPAASVRFAMSVQCYRHFKQYRNDFIATKKPHKIKEASMGRVY
jgi:hypothetical protein